MKRIILQALSVFVLTLFAIFLFFFGQIPLTEGKHLLDPYIDTQFAENYSPQKFEQIETGMKLDDVFKLVGKPLYTGKSYLDTGNTNYYYTADGKLLKAAKENGQHGYEDFAWYCSTLEINQDNIVVSINKGWSHD